MGLQFTIRSSDLKRLRIAIDVNRCPEEGMKWIMYLEVSPSIAEFRFGGHRLQYPIDGKKTGYAKFPDFVIEEATRWITDRKPKGELEVSVGHGWLRCVESVSRDNIEVGYVKDTRTRRIHYTTDAELMVLGEILQDPSLLHPAMTQHIKDARDSIMGSVYRSAAELRERGVMQAEVEAEDCIQALVRQKLEEIKPVLRKRLDTLGIENLWKS